MRAMVEDGAGRSCVAVHSHDGVRGEAACVCAMLEGLRREDNGDGGGKVIAHEGTDKVIIDRGVLKVSRETS